MWSDGAVSCAADVVVVVVVVVAAVGVHIRRAADFGEARWRDARTTPTTLA